MTWKSIIDPRIAIVFLDEAVVTETLNLTSIIEMHDRQTVATAIVAQTQSIQAVLHPETILISSIRLQTTNLTAGIILHKADRIFLF